MDTIFIQIASYRDPELPKTLEDCINNAQFPQNLKFCIAHQFDESEDLSKFESDPRFIFIKIPYAESKGACWARNLIQQHYNNETYTLQLDSHHRFVKNWDTECIDMLKQLQNKGFKKPLLTGYVPSYDPEDDPGKRVLTPWQLNFDRFIPEGAVFFMPSTIPNFKDLTEPVLGRFYSAHFCFTLGQFCKEVPHDPNYYFHGEEISISVRAWTNGYDIFHPHKVIIWHEYTRKGRTKQWDDDKTWTDKNKNSHLRNRKLFEMDGEKNDIEFGIYGFGTERTVQEYEEFAGISFSKRGIQQYTLDKKLPPNPKWDNFEKSLLKIFKYCVNVSKNQFTYPAHDYDFWCVAFHSETGETIFRKDADANEIKKILSTEEDVCKIWREFNMLTKPKYWVIWPHSESKGWCERITGNL